MAKKKKQKVETGTKPRPPIITVMGHVDHGKTSLLDYIRKSRVVAKEQGGITQHIGTYQVEIEVDKKKRKLTFIDTPGHAAFAAMRSRGGRVADLVVLVVSATEGVKPQTVESIKHIKDAGVSFVVAMNKMDLPEANPEKVKSELAEHEILTEDRGGDIPVVEVSALKGTGVDTLLETLALMADMLEIQGDAAADLQAVVIESELDPKRGPVATVVVKQGAIQLRDMIYAGTKQGRVKALLNDLGKGVQMAAPGDGVLILGFDDVPVVGAIVSHKEIDKNTIESSKELREGKGLLPIIVKADVAGSLEAILESLPKEVQVLDSGVGDITENEVTLAKVGSARIVGFNVGLPETAKHMAETEEVIIKKFGIIYELLEFVEDELKRLTDPFYGRVITGKAEVLADFVIDKRRILGGKITEGVLSKGDRVEIIRAEKIVGSTRIANLQQGKDKVDKVDINTEFGAVLSPYVDFKPGDELVASTEK